MHGFAFDLLYQCSSIHHEWVQGKASCTVLPLTYYINAAAFTMKVSAWPTGQ